MTLPILAQTAREADPRRNYRLRDFLQTLGLRAVLVPDPGPAAAIEAAPAAEAPAPVQAPEGESGNGEEVPAASDVAAVIAEGQAQAERGETADRGSFAEHAEPASHLGPDAGHQLRSIPVPAKDETAEADLTPDAGAGQ